MNAKVTIHENGCVIAEKNWDKQSRILYVNEDTVLMQGKKKSYVVQIHKDLIPHMDDCMESDTGFIKFRADGGWLVGFQIRKSRFLAMKLQEQYPRENWKDERGDWDVVGYWAKMKTLEEDYPDYEVTA